MADDEAIRLLEEALHLSRNGEQAPGGDETWGAWVAQTEMFLRAERRAAWRRSLRDTPAPDAGPA